MAWGSSWYPKSMSVGERKAKASRSAERLGRKLDLDPVVIEGPLASTWWGKAWNLNLEGYADYSNRLPRGRSYVRHGSVLHLRIEPGAVSALVQGSQSRPYEVKISLSAMDEKARASLIAACAGKLDSAEALLAGRFPEDMSRLLTAEKTGLFPHPRGIRFSCSCPDSADLCKHVAAALYGVGARLDRDPSLFFKLRKIELEDLISRAVQEGTQKLLEAKGKGESARISGGDDELSALFGIDLEAADEKGTPPIPPLSAVIKPPRAGKARRPADGRGKTGEETAEAGNAETGEAEVREALTRKVKADKTKAGKYDRLLGNHPAMQDALSGLASLADEISDLEARLKSLLHSRQGRRE